MKKIILTLGLFVFAVIFNCCTKDFETVTSYEIKNDMDDHNSSFAIEDDGTFWEIIVYCFNSDNEIVRQDKLEPIKPGNKSPKIPVTSEIAKVKVSRKMVPDNAVLFTTIPQIIEILTIRQYAADYYYIETDKCITITLDSHNTLWGTKLD